MQLFIIIQLLFIALVAAIFVANRIGNYHEWFQHPLVQFIAAYISLVIVDALMLFCGICIYNIIQLI